MSSVRYSTWRIQDFGEGGRPLGVANLSRGSGGPRTPQHTHTHTHTHAHTRTHTGIHPKQDLVLGVLCSKEAGSQLSEGFLWKSSVLYEMIRKKIS